MLDFTNREKPVLTVKLDEKTILDVLPASRKIIGAMKGITNKSADELFEIVALILSCNKQDKRITVAMIDHLDILDIRLIFDEYAKIINKIEKDPN